MVKVKLSENIRFMDDVGSLTMDKGKTYELKNDSLKDMTFKRYLYTGNIRVVEGSLTFQYKAFTIFVDSSLYPLIYGKEYDNFFYKNVDLDTIYWIEFEKMPISVQNNFKIEDIPTFKIETPKEIVKDIKVEVKKVDGDINGDGKFDKEDLKLAGKTLGKGVKKLFKGKK
jgi:hypothetical protein